MKLSFVSTGDPTLDTFDGTISSGGSGPIWKIARRAVERGHDATIFSGTYGSGVENTINDVNVIEVSTPQVAKPINQIFDRFPDLRIFGGDEKNISPGNAIERLGPRLVFSWRVARLLKRQSVDVVYVRDRISGTFPIRLDIPSVFTVVAPDACDYFYEDSVDRHPANRLLFRYKQQFEEHCLRRADRTIAMNEDMAQYLRQKGFEDVSVITTGIDESEFHDEGLIEPEPLVLYVGRLDGNKRPEWVLEAFEQVAPPDFELHVFGSGPRHSYLKDRLQRSGRKEDITLHGAVSREEVLMWMRRGSLFVLPSKFETCGNVIVEAMGSGCAVIASDTSGGRQLIDDGETGLLFDKEDLNALQSALTDLFTNEEKRMQLAQNAYQHAKKKHTTDTITHAYISEGKLAIESYHC